MARPLPPGGNSWVSPEEATAPLPSVFELDFQQDIIIFIYTYIEIVLLPVTLLTLVTTHPALCNTRPAPPRSSFPPHAPISQRGQQEEAGIVV